MEKEGRPDIYLIIQYFVLVYRDISLNSYIRILWKRVSCIILVCVLNKRGKKLNIFLLFKSIVGASSFVIIIYKILYLYTYIILLYYIVCSERTPRHLARVLQLLAKEHNMWCIHSKKYKIHTHTHIHRHILCCILRERW